MFFLLDNPRGGVLRFIRFWRASPAQGNQKPPRSHDPGDVTQERVDANATPSPFLSLLTPGVASAHPDSGPDDVTPHTSNA
jgi:hypothetical protein